MEKFNVYIIIKSREGGKKQYLKTTQYFVDDVHEAKFYKSLAEAEKDRDIVSFNHKLWMCMLHEPKYDFRVIRV